MRTFDLAEEWRRLTGQPYIQSVWIANKSSDIVELNSIITASRDYGMLQLEAIAQRKAQEIGIPQSECLEYLQEVLQYGYNAQQQSSLELFYKKCKEYGLLTR